MWSPRSGVQVKDLETWQDNLLPSLRFGFIVLMTSAGMMDENTRKGKPSDSLSRDVIHTNKRSRRTREIERESERTKPWVSCLPAAAETQPELWTRENSIPWHP